MLKGVIVLPAVVFTWLGMVLAISFLETPLKFRAPGVTVPLGLGIGRVVFAALNRVEVVLLVVLGIALAIGPRSAALVGMACALAVLLAVQLAVLRPALRRRTDQVLTARDTDPPRSRHHLVYIALETVKVVVLVALGATALAAS